MKKAVIAIMAIVAAVSISGQVSAKKEKPAKPTSNYEYFCHRTNSVTNPYVKKPFSKTFKEVDGKGKNDHSQHAGPVVTTQAQAVVLKANHQKWGDIIPPVDPYLVDGYNWSTEGQAVFNNNCNLPAVNEPTEPDISYDVACNDAKTMIVVTVVNSGNGAGSITVEGEVIAVAAGATVTREFSDGTQITIVLDGETTPDYDQQVMCQTGGSGGGGGGTTPNDPSVVTPVELAAAQLPATAGINYAALLGLTSAAVIGLSIGGKRLFARFI